MKTSLIAGLVAGISFLSCAQASAQEANDGFKWLDRLNRASLVMLHEEGIVSTEQASKIADAVDALYEAAKEPGFKRTTSYSSIEPWLINFSGPEVTRLHTGRSSWDVDQTRNRLLFRENILDIYSALIDARQALLSFAKKHPDAIIPAYTGGVQAQPISLGHFLTAYAEAYGRHAAALEDVYHTLNESPHGAAALGTSSYPLKRERLSELLGFDRPIRNSYDAVLLATLPAQMQIGGTVAAMAITTGQLTEDLGNQYYLTRPWLTFPVGAAGSTIMPQKQNPNGINDTRESATSVMGDVAQYMFDIHKTESGHFAAGTSRVVDMLANTKASLIGVTSMFKVLSFHEDRALEQVLDDYAAATELANSLQRVGNIPFRDAHHVAMGVVLFGRSKGLRASEIKFDDFERVFSEVAKEYSMPQTTSGLTVEQLNQALSPQNMVQNAKGLGGPQSSEVKAMIEENTASIEANRKWLKDTRSSIDAAAKKLDDAFSAL
jgi:argininosuccinate lyase